LIYYNQSEVARHAEIEPDDSSEQLLSKVFRTSIQAIEETMDIAEFDRAADIIFKARHIDLYAVGGSATVARDLSHKLLKIGIKSTVYDDAHIMLMSAAVLSDDDAVLAISHSGATRAVNDPVKLAARNGAKVIAITNYAESPIARNAHVVLNSTSQGSHLLGENAASRIAQLNILDALFVAIAKKDLKQAEKNLMKTQHAVQDLREY
jgi:DNA-binding MurR/RpiR family transcriptional regulator